MFLATIDIWFPYTPHSQRTRYRLRILQRHLLSDSRRSANNQNVVRLGWVCLCHQIDAFARDHDGNGQSDSGKSEREREKVADGLHDLRVRLCAILFSQWIRYRAASALQLRTLHLPHHRTNRCIGTLCMRTSLRVRKGRHPRCMRFRVKPHAGIPHSPFLPFLHSQSFCFLLN